MELDLIREWVDGDQNMCARVCECTLCQLQLYYHSNNDYINANTKKYIANKINSKGFIMWHKYNSISIPFLFYTLYTESDLL